MKKIYPNIIIALNVMAHTPKLNDFVSAISLIMKKNICIIEVPYLINLMKNNKLIRFIMNIIRIFPSHS